MTSGGPALLILAAAAWGGCSASCGERPGPAPAQAPADAARDQGAPSSESSEISESFEIIELPVGLGAPTAFASSQRPGRAAYAAARTAEAASDWAAMVAAARAAVTADADHLEAAWLLATGLARLGEHAAVVAPLHVAVAGDFARWGERSLTDPALAEFLATPWGEAWRAHVEIDRAAYRAALGRALLVRAAGELYAVDVAASRWLRLTRTGGAVLAALRPERDRLAYVVRTGATDKPALAVGTVDLGDGRTESPVALATRGPVTLAHSARAPLGFWIGSGAAPTRWRHLNDDRALVPLPARTRAPGGPRLEIDGDSVRRRSAPIPQVVADWDEHGFASAIRLGSSNRVVSAPGAAWIDRDTIAWSPSRVHVAFVAQVEAPCAPGAASAIGYVANAATGTVTEVGRATSGLAVDWVGERQLALAGDTGVTILALDGAAPRTLPGADELLIPRRPPTCADESTPDEDLDAPVVEPP